MALVVIGCVMLFLTVYGTLREGFSNFAVNLGVEGLVTLTAIAVIGPLVRRSQEGGIRVYPRLNYPRFVREAARARRQVQILTTFTPLLEYHDAERFLEALRRLVSHQVQVEVLILHPDSLTAEQRQRELVGVGASVTTGIYINIRTLYSFIRSLPATDARFISARLYDANLAIIMHRWDDRGLVSFIPIGRLAEEGEQYEIEMRSPFGAFVESRFSDLWSDPTTISLSSFMTMPMTVLDGEDGTLASPIDGHYVTVDGNLFVASEEIIAAQALHREQALRVRNGSAYYDVVIVDPNDSVIRDQVADAFNRKYGIDSRALIRLLPASKFDTENRSHTIPPAYDEISPQSHEA